MICRGGECPRDPNMISRGGGNSLGFPTWQSLCPVPYLFERWPQLERGPQLVREPQLVNPSLFGWGLPICEGGISKVQSPSGSSRNLS